MSVVPIGEGNGTPLQQWQPTPVLLPRKSHGWRSLLGCSPWVAKSRTRLSDFTFTFHFHALEKEMATHSSVLAWRIPGMGEPGGLPSMGSHRVRHDRSDLAAAVPMAPHTFIQLSSSHFFYPRVRDQRDTCIMWMGLMQLVKGLKRKKTNIQWRKHSLFNQ